MGAVDASVIGSGFPSWLVSFSIVLLLIYNMIIINRDIIENIPSSMIKSLYRISVIVALVLSGTVAITTVYALAGPLRIKAREQTILFMSASGLGFLKSVSLPLALFDLGLGIFYFIIALRYMKHRLVMIDRLLAGGMIQHAKKEVIRIVRVLVSPILLGIIPLSLFSWLAYALTMNVAVSGNLVLLSGEKTPLSTALGITSIAIYFDVLVLTVIMALAMGFIKLVMYIRKSKPAGVPGIGV